MTLLSNGKENTIDDPNQYGTGAKYSSKEEAAAAAGRGDKSYLRDGPDKNAIDAPQVDVPTDNGILVDSPGYSNFDDMSTGTSIRDNPASPYDDGGDYSAIESGPRVEGMTVQNADGSVSAGDVEATTREVQDNELVANQLSGLLNSNSKFIQDARRQGLEQSNAMGGLGGSVGVGASMQAAMRSALPIATEDAHAYREAATQNMDALNQFAQLNHQRATQLELGNMDAKSRLITTQIGASAQMAATRLQTATQRDISMLDNQTQLRITKMNGTIQARLADDQFKYNTILNDQMGGINMGLEQVRGEYGLAEVGLTGQYGAASDDKKVALGQAEIAATNRATYTTQAIGAWDGYLQRITDLNGMEMDDVARSKAMAKIDASFRAEVGFINSLYPGMEPIDFGLGG